MTAETDTAGPRGVDAYRADKPNQRFDRAVVSEAFTRLHPSHREVIHKAYYLRWTTGQIAADLNVTEPVVKCRLHNGLRTLWHTLNDQAPRRRSVRTFCRRALGKEDPSEWEPHAMDFVSLRRDCGSPNRFWLRAHFRWRMWASISDFRGTRTIAVRVRRTWVKTSDIGSPVWAVVEVCVVLVQSVRLKPLLRIRKSAK
jgi:hypothetical protein